MFLITHLYNSASSYTAKPVAIQPIFMSIIFYHCKQLVIILCFIWMIILCSVFSLILIYVFPNSRFITETMVSSLFRWVYNNLLGKAPPHVPHTAEVRLCVLRYSPYKVGLRCSFSSLLISNSSLFHFLR
jgi:hypothetical protein